MLHTFPHSTQPASQLRHNVEPQLVLSTQRFAAGSASTESIAQPREKRTRADRCASTRTERAHLSCQEQLQKQADHPIHHSKLHGNVPSVNLATECQTAAPLRRFAKPKCRRSHREPKTADGILLARPLYQVSTESSHPRTRPQSIDRKEQSWALLSSSLGCGYGGPAGPDPSSPAPAAWTGCTPGFQRGGLPRLRLTVWF